MTSGYTCQQILWKKDRYLSSLELTAASLSIVR